MSEPVNNASIGELISDLSDQLSRLIRDELRLARVELSQSARLAGLGIGMVGIAGVLAFLGVAGLMATAMIMVALVLPLWLSVLIISVLALVVAAVLALVGKKNATRAQQPVEKVLDSVKADVDTVREPHHEHTE